MPSVGRKFLLAGKGGLNLTHSEACDAFLARYGARARAGRRAAASASAPQRAARLGARPGRRHLRRQLRPRVSHRHEGRAAAARLAAPAARRGRAASTCAIAGWAGTMRGALRFDTPQGEQRSCRPAPWCWRSAAAAGRGWVPTAPGCRCCAQRGVAVAPLRPANCGFEVAGWSEQLRRAHIRRAAGEVGGRRAARCGGRRLRQAANSWSPQTASRAAWSMPLSAPAARRASTQRPAPTIYARPAARHAALDWVARRAGAAARQPLAVQAPEAAGWASTA